MSDSSLLDALSDRSEDCARLQAFIGSRAGVGCAPRALADALEGLAGAQLELFWQRLNALGALCVARLGLAEDSDEDAHDAVFGTPAWSEGVGTLVKITQLVSAFSEGCKTRPKALLATLVTLHDILTLLCGDDAEEAHLQAAIAKACEHWWLQGELGRELVVTQLIAHLLVCAVDRDDSDAPVRRLHAVRAAFQLLDFDDESIESIRGLLLRCFVHPRFLKAAEGRRFLSYSLTFHEDVQELAIEVIKPQIATGHASLASAYGDVLLRGWRETGEGGEGSNLPALRLHLEDLLQSLAHEAIHAVDHRYFSGLREVLRSLHDSKRLKEVDSLLLRIYGPILWRSLRCANALVRAQAATLFFDVFPVQDGSATASSTAENDHLLQRQFELLKTLLEDSDHRVRAVAASGCCRVLNDFWEAVPPAITHQLLSFIAGKLGIDASSAVVRLAVVHGLGELLSNPRSHATLKSLLPAIANMLHDHSDKVRAGFVKILTKVRPVCSSHASA
jgi:condensin-2 complex subunit G2